MPLKKIFCRNPQLPLSPVLMNDDINEGCVAGEEICGGTKSMSEFGGITTKLKSMSRMDIPIWDNFLSFPNENTIN